MRITDLIQSRQNKDFFERNGAHLSKTLNLVEKENNF